MTIENNQMKAGGSSTAALSLLTFEQNKIDGLIKYIDEKTIKFWEECDFIEENISREYTDLFDSFSKIDLIDVKLFEDLENVQLLIKNLHIIGYEKIDTILENIDELLISIKKIKKRYEMQKRQFIHIVGRKILDLDCLKSIITEKQNKVDGLVCGSLRKDKKKLEDKKRMLKEIIDAASQMRLICETIKNRVKETTFGVDKIVENIMESRKILEEMRPSEEVIKLLATRISSLKKTENTCDLCSVFIKTIDSF